MVPRLALVLLAGAVLSGCVTHAPEQLVTQMPPTQTASQPVVPFSVRKIEVAPFKDDQYHSPLAGMAFGKMSDWISIKD